MYDVFSLPDTKFPSGFLWGSATAGHQIEGDNVHSQHWHKEIKDNWKEKSGKACDHYRLYKEDIGLLSSLGHKSFRLSVEWSRIEPEEGKFDAAATEHYVDELRRLRDAGLKTFVTLHHFTHPQWFEEKKAFQTMENMGYWERYLGYIVPRIAGLVDFWNVINEFNLGNQPERVDFKLNMIRYHARAYHIIKHHTAAPVSTAHAFTHYMPARWNDKSDRLMTDLLDFCDHEFFFHAIRTGEILYPFRESALVPEVKGTMDFWSVNAYTRHMVSMRDTMPWGPKAPRFEHKVLKMIPMDFYLEEMYPECLTAGLERLSDKPIYITENGCSCDDDRFRIVYIALHLSAISEAIRKGADVRGYLYWSLMDNYEWGSFKPRFGLVDVDWKTFKRTPKPSAEFYKGIIAENGFSQANLRKFLTELPSLAKPV